MEHGRVGKRLAAAGALAFLSACAHAPEPEQPAGASPCFGDTAEWVRAREAGAHFKTAYAGFDAHMLAFNSRLQTGVDTALRLTYPEGMKRYAALYAYAEEAVGRLGKLMPLETDETGALSMAGLADQIYEDAIRDPGDGDDRVLLRAALAREILAAAPDAGRRTLDFLTVLDMTRRLLEEKSQGRMPTTQQTLAALRDAGEALDETYRVDFRPLLQKTVADPDTDDLEARLASRLARLCTARRLCMTKGEGACLAGDGQFE